MPSLCIRCLNLLCMISGKYRMLICGSAGLTGMMMMKRFLRGRRFVLGIKLLFSTSRLHQKSRLSLRILLLGEIARCRTLMR